MNIRDFQERFSNTAPYFEIFINAVQCAVRGRNLVYACY
jgi:hypothetical protein